MKILVVLLMIFTMASIAVLCPFQSQILPFVFLGLTVLSGLPLLSTGAQPPLIPNQNTNTVKSHLRLCFLLFQYQAIFLIISLLFFKLNVSSSLQNGRAALWTWSDFSSSWDHRSGGWYFLLWPLFMVFYSHIGFVLSQKTQEKWSSDIASIAFLNDHDRKNKWRLWFYNMSNTMVFGAQAWCFFLLMSLAFYLMTEALTLGLGFENLFAWPIASSTVVLLTCVLVKWRLGAIKRFGLLFKNYFWLILMYGLSLVIMLSILSGFLKYLQIPVPGAHASRLFGTLSFEERTQRWSLFILGWFMVWLPVWSSFLGQLLCAQFRKKWVWFYNSFISLCLGFVLSNAEFWHWGQKVSSGPITGFVLALLCLVFAHQTWGATGTFREWCSGFLPVVGPLRVNIKPRLIRMVLVSWFCMHFGWFYFFGFIIDQLFFNFYMLFMLIVLGAFVIRSLKNTLNTGSAAKPLKQSA